MLRNRSFNVKMVKDNQEPKIETPLMAAINEMTPEQLDQLQKKLLNQMAFRIGAIIVAKVAVAIILNAIAKKLENPNQ